MKKYEFNGLTVTVESQRIDFGLKMEDLFEVSLRINPKRDFLFVSQVIGKYVAKNPKKILEMSKLFSSKIENKPSIFIGFAETATSLGHSIFSNFKDSKYIHSTRQDEYLSTLEFEESHSHATDHRIFLKDEDFFKNDMPIVLIDDELTTGNTMLKLIRQLHLHHPRKKYSIFTILDWRDGDSINKAHEMEKELGINIDVISAMKGTIECRGTKEEYPNALENRFNYISEINIKEFENLSVKYLTGRYGISSKDNAIIEYISSQVAKEFAKDDSRKLVLGTGEFIYIPLKIADKMSGDVWYQSSGRSPILPIKNSGTQNKFQITNIHEGYNEYIYNIPENFYESVYIIYENKPKDYSKNKHSKLVKDLKKLGIKKINIIFLGDDE